MTTELCREYAEALYALAAENDHVKTYLDGLDTAAALFADNPEYVELLACPAIPRAERDGLLEQALGSILPEQVLTFIQLLCAHGRIRSLNDCITEYRRMYETAVSASMWMPKTTAQSANRPCRPWQTRWQARSSACAAMSPWSP